MCLPSPRHRSTKRHFPTANEGSSISDRHSITLSNKSPQNKSEESSTETVKLLCFFGITVSGISFPPLISAILQNQLHPWLTHYVPNIDLFVNYHVKHNSSFLTTRWFYQGFYYMATMQGSGGSEDSQRQKDLETYRKKLIEHRELDAKLKKSEYVC